MKKKILLIILASISFLISIAQNNNEITILYLLPFHSQGNIPKISNLKNSEEIYQIKPFEMMGFWCGAKLALQEYNQTNKKINVIVRDVVTDIYELQKILEDSVLMMKVDIIVGPFYGSLFSVAADYAKKHNKTIINPFSTRFDFVENNPKVFKLVPSLTSRPETVDKVFLTSPDEYNIILWCDTATTQEMNAFVVYFREKNIPFKEVISLSLLQNSKKKNLIISFIDNSTRIIQSVHTFLSSEMDNNILIVPEKWFNLTELTEDFYNLPHLYYFTDYFVNENDTKVKEFKADYLLSYGAPAELAAYSFQGYDITHYFIDLFFADFNTNNVIFNPLSYKFQWKPIQNGGYENTKTRLIRIKDFELKEITFE